MYPTWPSQELLYVPCWEKECETLYRSFLRAPVETNSGRAASSLHSQLDKKRQERLEEVVNSIDFSHSSRRSTINKVTSSSGYSFRLSSVSANSIAISANSSQLVKKRGAQDEGPRVHQAHQQIGVRPMEVSTPEGDSICDPFIPEELATVLKHM